MTHQFLFSRKQQRFQPLPAIISLLSTLPPMSTVFSLPRKDNRGQYLSTKAVQLSLTNIHFACKLTQGLHSLEGVAQLMRACQDLQLWKGHIPNAGVALSPISPGQTENFVSG